MPITNLQPVMHPTQPVSLNLLAIRGLVITDGDAIDAPAQIAVQLRPWAEVEAEGGAVVSLSAPNVALQEFVIEDVYKWAGERAAAGDMLPAQVLAGLVQAVGEEYARRQAPQP